MDKPPSKRSPSSPLTSSDPPPKQPKTPRLDLVAPEVSGAGPGPSSVANPSLPTPMADSILADDSLTLTVARRMLGIADAAMTLVYIVSCEKDISESAFDGCGWNDVEEVRSAIARDPELKPLLVHCVERGTLEPLRAKALELKRPARNINGKVPMVEDSDVQRATEKAWKTPYQGDSSTLFVRALHTMNTDRTRAPYSNFVPIIQSSGMGKSRMVDEAAKVVFTLPFNLRSDADESAYPRPNVEVRDFLTGGVGSMCRNELEFRYLCFFKELFDRVNAELASLERCDSYEAFAFAWYNEFTKERQEKLYGETVQNSLEALKDRPPGEASAFYTTVEASAQALLATIVHKSAGQQGTGLSTGGSGARQPVRLMLSFDESHELLRDSTTPDDEGHSRTAYQVLCRALNSVQRQDVFVVHVSTSPGLNHSSPHMPVGNVRSFRWRHPGPVPPDTLQAPFVELPFDAFVNVEEGGIGLAQVAGVAHLAKFGRPLFHTISQSGDSLDLIRFAKQKIYGNVSEQTEDGQLAALSLRLLFEFDPRRELARDKEAELVAGHMRVAYSVPTHRRYIRSGTPSEPLLAEAAAHVMMDSADLLQTPYVEGTIQRLAMFRHRGLISTGERGELVGRLILTLAHDKAILSTQPRPNPRFSKSIGVLAFLEALVGPQHFARIKKSTPANVPNGTTLEAAFAAAKLNFTHFVRGGDGSVVSDQVAWAALARCMAFAFACPNSLSQRTIDVYIPVLLWDEHLSRWVVSGIFIQFGNRTAAAREKVTIDATNLGFFTRADPRELGEEEAARCNTRPYITIVMSMGRAPGRPRPGKKPKATRVHTPRVPEGPASRTDSPSEVDAEAGPARVPSQRCGSLGARGIYPRYAITIIGCSPNVYNVVPSKDSISSLLASQDILDEHPRSGDYIDAVLRLKPFWSKNANSFHWADISDEDEEDEEVEGVFVDGVDESDCDVDVDMG